MKVIRAAGIVVACAVHGALIFDSSQSKAVDLSSGSINASHFSLSINYQPVNAAQSGTPKSEDMMPAEQVKMVSPSARTSVADTKAINEVATADNPRISKSQNNVKRTKPVEEIIRKPVENQHRSSVEQEIKAEPTELVAAAPTQNNSQGVHEVVVAKPLFASPPAPPSYPKIARKRGQQGTVWIEVLLAKTGEQIRAEIHQSSGVSLLDRAALTVVQKWQFIAHQINGVAVASRIRIPVEFSLD